MLLNKDKENINETRKKEVEKKITFVNRILPKRGHKIWKFNISLNTLIECEFLEESKELKWGNAVVKDFSKTKKVIIEENCIYFNSLNIKNAVKILKRDYGIIYNIQL